MVDLPIVVRGTDRPGRTFASYGDVHVGVQVGRTLVATVSLTDEKGGPRCARYDPPAIAWSLE